MLEHHVEKEWGVCSPILSRILKRLIALSFSPFKITLPVVLSYIVLIVLRYVLSHSTLSKIFIMKLGCILSQVSSESIEKIMQFLSLSLFM